MSDIRESWAQELTHIIYFSIEPKASGELDTSKMKTGALKKLQRLAKRSKVQMLISLGGWNRSRNFAPMATNTDSRRKFVSNLTAFCRKHGFAGADFDWEFPKGRKQEEAYAVLLVETKRAFRPHGMLVTVAVGHNKRLTADAYKAVDYVHLMAYDHGVRHSTYADALADVKRQLAFGAPREKLCLGMPFYGRNVNNRNDARTYSEIVKVHKPAPGIDEVGGVYYNGVNTIQKKTQWAIDNGLAGVMIWELGQDTTDGTSLLSAIHRTVRKTGDSVKESPLADAKRVLKNPESKQILHRYFSGDCFNKCWGLIDKKSRTDAETEQMLLLANASLWHWTQRNDCEPKNLSVAYWQLARVYCLAGDAAAAKQFARKCVKVSVDGKLDAFYLGYGYEALANASLLAGEPKNTEKHLDLARAQLSKIADKESKKLLAADLDKLQKQLEKSKK